MGHQTVFKKMLGNWYILVSPRCTNFHGLGRTGIVGSLPPANQLGWTASQSRNFLLSPFLNRFQCLSTQNIRLEKSIGVAFLQYFDLRSNKSATAA